jgi:hypothetical protein
MRRKNRAAEVISITGARTGLTEDVRGRQRRYVISMIFRTLCVLAAVALWNVERIVAWVPLVLGAVLPYVAVVIANAGRENAPALPSSLLAAPPRAALGAGESRPADPPGASHTASHGASRAD